MILNVGPWKVSVDLTSSEDLDGDYGDWTLATKTIRVRDNLSPLEMTMTLIHEVFHALSDLHHLRLSEQSVRALENSITQLIQSHPDIASLLVKSVSHDSDPRYTDAHRAPWRKPEASGQSDDAPAGTDEQPAEPDGSAGDRQSRVPPGPAGSSPRYPEPYSESFESPRRPPPSWSDE